MKSQLLFLLAAFLFLLRIWEPTIIFTDELLIYDSARAMADGGSWIIPTVNGAPHLVKPPLLYWILAVFLKIYPHPYVTGRVLMGLFGMGILFFTYKITQSRTVLTVLMCSIPMIYFTKTANFDLPNTFFSIAMIYFYTKEKNVPAGFCLGLGILTRSYLALIPLVLPLYDKKYVRFSAIISVALAVSLPWHIAAFMQAKDIFLRDYVGISIFRHLSTIPGDSVSSPFYYLRLLILFPPILFAFFERNKLWVWILTALGILTVSQTRHEWYLLPVIPPLSILAGNYLTKHKNYFTRWAYLSMILFPVAMLFFLPLPESGVTKAVRMAQSSMKSGETLYEINYPLIPVTNTYPGRKIILTTSPPAGSMVLYRSSSGTIEFRRVTPSLFELPL